MVGLVLTRAGTSANYTVLFGILTTRVWHHRRRNRQDLKRSVTRVVWFRHSVLPCVKTLFVHDIGLRLKWNVFSGIGYAVLLDFLKKKRMPIPLLGHVAYRFVDM